jgi:hypothetical protein
LYKTTNTFTQTAEARDREKKCTSGITLYTYYKCTWFIKSSSTEIHTKPKPNKNKLITKQEFLLSFLLPLPLNSTSVNAITKVQLTIKGTHQLLGYIENVNLLDKT